MGRGERTIENGLKRAWRGPFASGEALVVDRRMSEDMTTFPYVRSLASMLDDKCILE